MKETELWPRIKAKHFGAVRTNRPSLIVVHTPIWKEASDGAEQLGRYFATMEDNRVASAHIGADSDSIVQYVGDSTVAFAAPGANTNGLHIEIIGTHTQTKEQWQDKFSIAALALGADAVAQWCLKYSLPVMKLNDEQLRKGQLGIVGHDQVSRVFQKSDHTDPGPNFPWLRFIQYVRGAYEDRR